MVLNNIPSSVMKELLDMFNNRSEINIDSNTGINDNKATAKGDKRIKGQSSSNSAISKVTFSEFCSALITNDKIPLSYSDVYALGCLLVREPLLLPLTTRTMDTFSPTKFSPKKSKNNVERNLDSRVVEYSLLTNIKKGIFLNASLS